MQLSRIMPLKINYSYVHIKIKILSEFVRNIKFDLALISQVLTWRCNAI